MAIYLGIIKLIEKWSRRQFLNSFDSSEVIGLTVCEQYLKEWFTQHYDIFLIRYMHVHGVTRNTRVGTT